LIHGDLTAIIEKLHDAEKLLITTHIQPDGDAMGSTTGLTRSLRQAGKHVDLAYLPEVSPRFAFLVEGENLVDPAGLQPHYDLVVILDSGDFERSGMAEELRAVGAPIVNIDHHGTNPAFGDLNLLDEQASSTSEMVVELLQAAGLPLDNHVAEPLYLGILTDTRFFQNAGVRQRTYEAMTRLLSTGLDPQPIVRRLTQNKTLLDLRTLGLALTNLRTAAGGRIGYTVIRLHELESIGANPRHCWSAGVFGMINSLATSVVTFALVEHSPDRTFCEFRSKPSFDVREIALSFGGGGHRAASGCSPSIPIDEMLPQVLEKLEQALAVHSEKAEGD
jgi:phosphoesterase RecJ-like protein